MILGSGPRTSVPRRCASLLVALGGVCESSPVRESSEEPILGLAVDCRLARGGRRSSAEFSGQITVVQSKRIVSDH